MPSSYKRQRSNSEYEESNVSAFVDSCINFKSNVTFHTTYEGKQLANEAPKEAPHIYRIVVLLGNQEQLHDKEKLLHFFPYYNQNVELAIKKALLGKNYVAEILPYAHILIGAIASRASRHNAPLRPDMITRIVKNALQYASTEEYSNDITSVIEIYCCESENELCIATAIARAANRSFSARSGRSKNGYWDHGHMVRVIFAPNTTHYALEAAEKKFACNNREALDTAVLMVQLCQRLVDAPTNLLDTITLTEISAGHVDLLKSMGINNVSIDILSGEALREQGYGGLYGVGKAAEYPPHLVTLTYTPAINTNERMEKLALVGKGIVYDTGGLCLKSAAGMSGMKHDMGGAAAVLCGFLALSRLFASSPMCLTAVLCLADNAVGPQSQRRDDIVRLRSGITVEVNNTDAEGRLVLADGVYHATAPSLTHNTNGNSNNSYSHRPPDVLIDIATLTGAQRTATGVQHAAVYTNSAAMETQLLNAGRSCGDLCFPVLYCPEFHSMEFGSTVADCRNGPASGGNAAVSCAAYFIGQNFHSSFNGVWAHIDIAGPVAQESATGFGVALLLQTFAASVYTPK
ncbi:Peptidase M17 [Trypanosoma melophagium]|uniref:Peptidase M17 n=1 Tax=Trypanosoma melophagium TaxID=715481 RepID=UPI003519E406|nr:Peptidase M17 [Trypanosoma melophagium]